MLSRMLYRTAQAVAPAYIAGPKVGDAIGFSRKLGELGWNSTLCPWDGPGQSIESIINSYKEALTAIKNESPKISLSIKAPSFNYDFEKMKEIIEIASKDNIRLHFDALAPETAASSLKLLEKTLKIYKNIGYTLPSRWKRSVTDAQTLNGMGVTVRVVKGQWPDPEAPQLDPVHGYLEIIDILSGKAAKVAVATHDVSLARTSLKTLLNSGTVCELEQLFGLPLCADRVAIPLNVSVRVYIPYGYAYLPYALSEIKRRPVILAWFLKDMIVGKNKLFKR
jgi:proline dehydrogenase